MDISIFGIFIIVFSIFLFLKNIKKGMRAVFISLFFLRVIVGVFVDRGYIIQVGFFTLKYQTYLSSILFVSSVFCILFGIYSPRVLKFGLLFLGILSFGLVLRLFFPYNNLVISSLGDWERYLRGIDLRSYPTIGLQALSFLFTAFRFVVALSVLSKVINETYKKEYLHLFIKLSTIIVVFGIVEFIILNVFKTNMDSLLLDRLLGKNTYTSLSERNGIYAIKGFRIEPSYFSFCVFFISLTSFIELTTRKNNIALFNVLGSIILLFLTMSFSSLLYLAFFCLLVFVYLVKKKNNIVFVLLFCVFALLLFAFLTSSSFSSYFIDRFFSASKAFTNLITSNNAGFSNWSSEAVRFTSIFYSLNIFANSPLFGLGLGLTDCHSFAISMITNIGVMGSVSYFLFLGSFLKFRDKKISAVFFLTSIFIGSFGFVFDLIFPTTLLITTKKKVK